MKVFLLAILAVSAFGQSAAPVVYRAENFATQMVMEAQAVPTSNTVIFTGRSLLVGGWISCGGTGQSVTIKDGNGQNFLNAIPIAANSTVNLGIWAGDVFPVSIAISATGAGCSYTMRVRQ